MEREVGGGIGMGSTCRPMAVSFQCMTKFTTNKKKRERDKRLGCSLELRMSILRNNGAAMFGLMQPKLLLLLSRFSLSDSV